MAFVSFGSPLARTRRTASATAELTDVPTPRGVMEKAAIMAPSSRESRRHGTPWLALRWTETPAVAGTDDEAHPLVQRGTHLRCLEDCGPGAELEPGPHRPAGARFAQSLTPGLRHGADQLDPGHAVAHD